MTKHFNKPDYLGGNIVNLMQSISRAREGNIGLYPNLCNLDISGLSRSRNLVLLIIDGLGYNYLCSKPNSFLYQHLHSKITTVTPPTTAAAVSSFLTGLAPQQHGLTGWFTYFHEIDEVLTVLPYTLRNSQQAPNQAVSELINLPSFFDTLETKTYSVMPRFLKDSVFNQMLTGNADLLTYTTLENCLSEIYHVCKVPSKKYIYAYWSQFDALAHEHGINSPEVESHFHMLDRHIANFAHQLKSNHTQLLICSDHGFIDSPIERRLTLNNYPQLMSCLRTPLCGEPRLAMCYIQDDTHEIFSKLCQKHLGHAATLYRGEKLIEQNFFGLGETHPALRHRVGDYVLVMEENYTLTQQLANEAYPNLVGYHGGLSESEMYVPLILVEL